MMGGMLLTYLQHTVVFVETKSALDRWRQIVLGSHDIHRYTMMFWRSHLLGCIQQEYRPQIRDDSLLRARMNTCSWLFKENSTCNLEATSPIKSSLAAKSWMLSRGVLQLLHMSAPSLDPFGKDPEQSGSPQGEFFNEKNWNATKKDD